MRNFFSVILLLTWISNCFSQPVNLNRFYPITSDQTRWAMALGLCDDPNVRLADSLFKISLNDINRGVDPSGNLLVCNVVSMCHDKDKRIEALCSAAQAYRSVTDTLSYAYADYHFKMAQCYGVLNKPKEREFECQQAIDLLSRLDSSHNALLYYLNYRINNQFAERSVAEGFATFDLMVKLSEEIHNYYYLASAYLAAGNLIKYYTPSLSVTFFEFAKLIATSHNISVLLSDPMFYLSIGNGYTVTNKNDDALAHYHKGLNLVKDNNGSQKLKSQLYYYIGTAHKNMGNTNEALAYLDSALSIERMVEGETSFAYYRILNIVGTTLNNAGRYQEALPIFRRVVDFYIKTRGTGNTYFTQTAIAQLAKSMQYTGLRNEALRLSHQNICYFFGVNDTLNFYDVPKVEHLISAEKNYRELEFIVYRKIEVMKDMFSVNRDSTVVDAIMNHFEFIMNISDINATASQTPDELMGITNRYKYNSNKLLDFVFGEDLPEKYQVEAYQLVAKSKAFSMLAESAQYSNVAVLLNDKSLEQNEAHKNNILAELQFVKGYDKDKYSALTKELLRLEEKEFLSRYSNPVKASKVILPQLISTRSMNIHSGIAPNETVVDYYVTKTAIHTFVVTGKTFFTQSVLLPKNFNEILEQFYRAIKTSDTQGISSLSLLLTDLLIGKLPIVSGTSLVIIPDEKLFVVPFDLLNNHGNYLLVSNPISYRYSSHLFRSPDHSLRSPSLLAFAPVFDSKRLASVPDALRGMDAEEDMGDIFRNSNSLSAIPETSTEVNTIGKLFGSKGLKSELYLRGKSTKQNAQKLMGNSSILHIATHGFANRKNPGMSGLAFMSATSDSGLESSYLSLKEIANLKLNSDLVVLSACKSGYGSIVRGEGIMSLSRGFISAGARNVMASLWKIHDVKTKELMVQFYKYLLDDKLPYSQALQKAKLDCIKKGFLPLDWAGFVLIGN